jgi:hypothetical protein
VIAGLLFYLAAQAADFSFPNFASGHGLRLVGSANRDGASLRLTPAKEQRAGAAWFTEKQHVAAGFETDFRFRLTNQGGLGRGADGFAFVVHNSGPDAMAGRGNAGGFAVGDGWGDPQKPGIPLAIAIFFDTFRNEEGGDPSDNYVAICTNGKPREMRWPPPRLAIEPNLKTVLKDGRVHDVRVVYDPPVMSVYLDGQAVLTAPVDFSPVIDGDGKAYVGFTASTGGGWENHDILSWSFRRLRPEITSAMVSSDIAFLKTACLEGRNLCTPEQAQVEALAEGEYRIIVPAHLEWAASIPNPGERGITISGARGFVCWDPRRGREGCGGPEALAMKTTGQRTYFSVKDTGGAHGDNEGYLEFHARIDSGR